MPRQKRSLFASVGSAPVWREIKYVQDVCSFLSKHIIAPQILIKLRRGYKSGLQWLKIDKVTTEMYMFLYMEIAETCIGIDRVPGSTALVSVNVCKIFRKINIFLRVDIRIELKNQ